MINEHSDGRPGAPGGELSESGPDGAEQAANGPASPKPPRARGKKRPVAQAPAAQPAPASEGEQLVTSTDLAVRILDSAPAETAPVRVALSGEQLAEQLHEVEVEIRNADRSGSPSNGVAELAAGSVRLVAENLLRMAEPQVRTVRALLDRFELGDYLDPDFWQGIGMVLRYQFDAQVEFVQRRMRGEYTTDAYGMDREIVELVQPVQSFLYRTWWRTSTEGAAQLPASGRAMLVANQSGVLPWDGAQISSAVAEERPDLAARTVRPLYLNEFNHVPLVGQFLSALGQVPALPEHAVRLLDADELVCVFPEGIRGAGKLFKDRYRLARFGRGNFIAAALRTGAPIVPVAVIGAEEATPVLANIEPLARLLRLPFFPVTPFFPWLGPLGLLPLPTRWKIVFGAPMQTAQYGPDAADDPLTVFMLSEQIRSTIQETIDEQVAGRRGVF